MTFEDNREQNSGNTSIGIPRNPSMFKHAVGEPYMDSQAIFESPVRLGSVQWNTANSTGTQFLQFDLPKAFADIPTFHRQLLGIYVYYMTSIRVTLQINATPQHMGLLRLWYDPFTQFDLIPNVPDYSFGKMQAKSPNIYNTSGQPHVDVQARDSSPVDLDIRFEHPQSCLTTNSVDPISNLGRVGVMIVSPLEAPPTSSASVTVQMWIQFVNPQLAFPIWPHTPNFGVLAEQQSGDIEMQEIIQHPVNSPAVDHPDYVSPDKAEGSYGPPPIKKQKSWWERGLGALGGIAGAVWNGFTGNWGGAIQNGVSAISSLLMDKPSDPQRAVHNMIFPVTPLAHTQGIGGAVRLDAAPIGGYTNIDFSSSDPEEMKLARVMKVPMLAYTFDWSENDAPGTRLLLLPVMPTVCHYVDTPGVVEASDGTQAYPAVYRVKDPTYLSHFSSLFKFWSGSIKYHFQFVTTSLHTGKVIVTFTPNNYLGGTPSLPELTCTQTAEFDVAGQSNFDFTPGWVSALPRKSIVDWSAVDYAAEDDRTVMGWLEVKVTGTLTTTNAIPGTVHCFVWMSAADDFFCETLVGQPFEFPAGFTVRSSLPPPAPEILAEQQSDEDPSYGVDEGKDRVNNMVSQPPSQMTNQAIGDVRDPCRRANYLGVYIMLMKPAGNFYRGTLSFYTNPLYTSNAASFVPSIDQSMGQVNPYQNFLAYITPCYTFYSGSIDWTFIPHASNGVHFKANYYPLLSDDVNRQPLVQIADGSYGALPAHTTLLSQQGALQVTTPFTSNYNQLATMSQKEYDEEVYSSGVVGLEATTTDITSLPMVDDTPCLYVEVYKSLGDDGRFSWLVSPQRTATLISATPPT